MTDLRFAALSGLPVAAKHALMECADVEVACAVLADSQVEVIIPNAHLDDSRQRVRNLAFRRSDNIERVETELFNNRAAARQSARNPHLHAASLEKAASAVADHLWYQLAIHPNTPEHVRRQLVTPARATELFSVGQASGRRAARAGELLFFNPWMAEHPRLWPKMLHRWMRVMPHLTPEAQQAVSGLPVRTRLTNRFQMVGAFELAVGTEPSAATDLVRSGSIADAFEFCRTGDDTQLAAVLLGRINDSGARDVNGMVMSAVIGLVVEQYGARPALTDAPFGKCATTTRSGAASISPLCEYLHLSFWGNGRTVQDANWFAESGVSLDAHQWRTAVRLAGDGMAFDKAVEAADLL